jgi:hypothetical protein
VPTKKARRCASGLIVVRQFVVRLFLVPAFVVTPFVQER